jgi:Winged helix DNA-binding domain
MLATPIACHHDLGTARSWSWLWRALGRLRGRRCLAQPVQAKLLAAAQWADFKYIRDELGLSDSALSKQLSALESAG